MNKSDTQRMYAELRDLRLPEEVTVKILAYLNDEAEPLDLPAVLDATVKSPFTLSHSQQQMLAVADTLGSGYTVSSVIDVSQGGVVLFINPAILKGHTLGYHSALDTFSVVQHNNPASAAWVY